MFGIMEALLGFIRRQVGLRTDAASASGSVHAKVTDVKDTLATIQKPRTSNEIGSFNSGSLGTDYVQVGLITGRGMLMELQFYNSSGSVFGGNLRVTVDDTVVYTLPVNIAGETTEYPNSGFYFGGGVSATGNSYNAMLSFKSSLKLEANKTSEYGNFQIKWRTELE